MGGFGSGRSGGRATAEATASYIIAVSILTSARLQMGRRGTVSLSFGEEKFPVEVNVDTTDPHDPFIELTHQTRDWREGECIVRDRVRLTWTVPTYGGRRWWFICPRIGRRTTKLFLPNGGWHFWSRRAYGLGYACQRNDRFGRLQRRAANLNRELGGEGWDSWDTPPMKPKWMRWRTYERRYERWERVVEKANEEFAIRAARLLKWI